MDEILREVVELENQGYQFEAAEASFDLLVKRAAGTFTAAFRAAAAITSNVETHASGDADDRSDGEAA